MLWKKLTNIYILGIVVVNGDNCENSFSDGVVKASNMDVKEMVIVDKR